MANSQSNEPNFTKTLTAIVAVVGSMAGFFGALSSIFSGLGVPIGALLVGLVITVVLYQMKFWTGVTAGITWGITIIFIFIGSWVISQPTIIIGEIINDTGNPVVGLGLVLTNADGIQQHTVTDQDGYFEVRNVPQGRYTISVTDTTRLLYTGNVPSGWQRIFVPTLSTGGLIFLDTNVPAPAVSGISTATSTAIPLSETNTPSPTPIITSTPTLTRTPRPPTNTPFFFSGGLYDDFNNTNQLDSQLWYVDYPSVSEINNIIVSPIDEALQISNRSSDAGTGFFLNLQDNYGTNYTVFQLDMKMITNTGTSNITINTSLEGRNWLEFGIGEDNNNLKIFAKTGNGVNLFNLPANYDEWYTLRIEFVQEQSSLELYVDDQLLSTYAVNSDVQRRSNIQVWRGSYNYTIEGFIDNVYIEYNN